MKGPFYCQDLHEFNTLTQLCQEHLSFSPSPSLPSHCGWLPMSLAWPDPVTEPVSPHTLCRNFSVAAHTVARLLFIRAKKVITNWSFAFHLCLPSNPKSKRRKINLGMFSYFNAHRRQSSQWLSTLLIKQDVPAHMQMSSNAKHVGGNLYSHSQARCAETKEEIPTTEL